MSRRSEGSSKRSILVVDDTPANLTLLGGMLREQGYTARPVPNGRLALQAAASYPPDLILLDITMPEMNGYEVCKRFKADPKLADIPIIFISSHSEPLNKVTAFESGGVDYITKPFHLEEVLARVETHLALHQLQVDLKQRNTELTERTQELSRLNAQLARSTRAKDEFLASMSHELRTPLNAILSISETLQERVYGPLTDKQMHSVGVIEDSGRHLLSLINDVLDLSKVAAGRLELEIASVSVQEVAEASLIFIKEAAHKKQLHVSTRFDPDVTTVRADVRRLKQVLVNLLTNAVKFTPEGGSVGLEIAGDRVREVVKLAVWDTGVGIAPGDEERLFEPFTQLDQGLAREYEGTGLGLSLVARMIELHGGSVTVESGGRGKGSRFTVSLPWSDEAVVREPAVVEKKGVGTDVTIGKVLIIEDSKADAAQIARYLTELGAEVDIHVEGGIGAIDRAVTLQPEAIVLDLMMPKRSGLTVLSDLKTNPATKDIPVVIISAVDERTQGIEAGAVDYLVKPITRDQVRDAFAGLGQSTAATVVGTSGHDDPGETPLILLAEDNEANIESTSDYLEAKGFRVVVARNGREAVDRVGEIDPDLILMDIQMPGMDGLEATRRIRRDLGVTDTPIIALTALAMSGDRERCLEAGATEYLSKPVSLRGLVDTIKGLLDTSVQANRGRRGV